MLNLFRPSLIYRNLLAGNLQTRLSGPAAQSVHSPKTLVTDGVQLVVCFSSKGSWLQSEGNSVWPARRLSVRCVRLFMIHCSQRSSPSIGTKDITPLHLCSESGLSGNFTYSKEYTRTTSIIKLYDFIVKKRQTHML